MDQRASNSHTLTPKSPHFPLNAPTAALATHSTCCPTCAFYPYHLCKMFKNPGLPSAELVKACFNLFSARLMT